MPWGSGCEVFWGEDWVVVGAVEAPLGGTSRGSKEKVAAGAKGIPLGKGGAAPGARELVRRSLGNK